VSAASPEVAEAGSVARLRRPPLRFGLAAAALVIVLDQLSKLWIVEVVMQPPQVIPVTSFFNLVMAWNRGVSFGLLDPGSEAGRWLLIAVALAIVAALGVWLWRIEQRLLGLAIGLIIGGALGNVIDRLRFGAVADFLDVHAAGWHFPAFNVADSAITVGATLIVADALFLQRRNR